MKVTLCTLGDKNLKRVQEKLTDVAVVTKQENYTTWDHDDKTRVLKEEQGFENFRPMDIKSLFAAEEKVKQEINQHCEIQQIQPLGRDNFTVNCSVHHETPGILGSEICNHVPTCHLGVDGNAKVTMSVTDKVSLIRNISPVNCCCLQVSHRELLEQDVAEEIMRVEVDHSRENIENKQKNHASCNKAVDSKIQDHHEENRTSFSRFTLSDIQSAEITGREHCSEILHTVINATNEHNIYTRGDKFMCDTCNVGFASLSHVQLHVKSHMPGKMYTCADCGRRVQYFSHLKLHIKSHLEITKCVKHDEVRNTVITSKHKRGSRSERRFKCDTCNVNLSSILCLQSHLNIHMSGKLYRCDDCGKKDYYFSCLKRHINSHLKKHLCISRNSNSTFSSDSMIPRQQLKQNSKTCYKCNVCSLSVLSHSGLLQHKRKHIQEQAYNSNTNCVDYSSKNVTSKRKPAHTVNEAFVCDLCGVMFSFRFNLLRHKKLHTKQKPYKCDICGMGFSYSCNMHEHKRSHTGEKPYLCHVCSATFSCKSNLLRHERVHTHDKPFLCDVCGAAFALQWHLMEHKRTHTGEKPYKCDLCGVKFAALGHLKKHRVIHTGERNYKCDTCGRTFSRQTNLQSSKNS